MTNLEHLQLLEFQEACRNYCLTGRSFISPQMTHTQTVQDAIGEDAQAFRALSRKYRSTLRNRAFAYLAAHPGCGDQNGFWRRLSARHVTQIGEASR